MPAWDLRQPWSDLRCTDFGYTFGLLLLVVIVAAIVGRLGRRQIAYAIVLMVLFALQSVFVAVRGSAPEIAALHPLNGFLIIAVAFVSGRDAWTARACAGGRPC